MSVTNLPDLKYNYCLYELFIFSIHVKPVIDKSSR